MNFKNIYLLFFIALLSCKSTQSSEIFLKDLNLKIEIAATDAQRAKGLMNRESLNENRGMLFVFDSERQVSFWMKNTLIPLSIAYIDKNGKILEIYDMTPLSTDSVTSKRSSVMYALEVNKGFFDKNGFKPGFIINLEPVKSYLKSSK